MLPNHLSFLDLESPSSSRKIRAENKYKIPCFFEQNQVPHTFHTKDNSQLNGLVDLVIVNNNNIGTDLRRQFELLETFNKNSKRDTKLYQDLQKNLEYLRTISNSQEAQIRSLKNILDKILFELTNLNNLPSKQDILALSKLIELNKPKDIELQSKALILEVKSQVENNKLEFEKYIKSLETKLQKIEKLAGE